MDETLRHKLKESALAMNIVLDGPSLDLFQRYYEELVLWNEKINLTSVRDPEEIIIKHFVDSLTPLPYIVRPEGRLLDLGSGGGFPGIPLKIVLPGLHLFLLEASRKKSSFLKHAIRTLRLSQAEVIQTRVETALKEERYSHMFDTVISRAAFKLSHLTALGKFFLSPGGLLIAMKGPHLEAEEKAAFDDPGMPCVDRHDIRLPVTGDRRNLFRVKAYS